MLRVPNPAQRASAQVLEWQTAACEHLVKRLEGRFKSLHFQSTKDVKDFVLATLDYANLLVNFTTSFNSLASVSYAREKLEAIASAQALLDELSAPSGRNADDTNALRRRAMSAMLRM